MRSGLGSERLDRVRAQVVYLLGEEANATYAPAPQRPAYAPVPFTAGALGAMAQALREAVRNGHASVGAGHLLLGLISDDGGLATRALVSLGVDLVALRETTETLLREHGGTG